jgi:uncharacterized protein GlcG (DUF336 family)
MNSNISTAAAQKAIDVATRRAAEIGVPMSVAVIDAGRTLIAFLRMDKALLGSVEIAQAKAYTARTVNARTADLGPLVQPGAPFYGLEVSHRQPLIVFGGGVPITHHGEVVGAIGVSGGSADQDIDVAETAVRYLESQAAI